MDSSSTQTLLKPEDVLPSLTAHNTSFLTLLNLIPPNYYLSPQDDMDDDDEDGGMDTKFMKKNKRKAKQEAQLAKSSEKKEKKRAKLDPANLKTVSQVQDEREKARLAKEAEEEGADDLSIDLDQEEIADEEVDDDDDGDETMTAATAPTIPAQSILTLRERLRNKVASMRNRRRVPDSSSATGANMIDIDDSRDTSLDGEDSGDGDSSVASTRDELLEERRKRRGEIRDNRRRARKEMRRQAMANANSNAAASKGKGPSQNNTNSRGAPGQTSAPGLLVKDSPSSSKSRDFGISSSAPTDLNFSSFQMPGESKKKRDKNALPSNPKQALAMLEARKAREAAKEGTDAETDADSSKWSKALSAAKGVKIRDDEALLKRSVKRKEKAKQKSATEWKDRAQEIKDKEAEKQKKRTDNLKARKDAKLAKKKGGAKGGGKKTKDRKIGGSGSKGQKGGGRAGFEGKKMGKSLKMGGKKGGAGGGGGSGKK